MSRKTFIESVGATCTNWQWSWSFINSNERFIVFGAWDRNTEGTKTLIFSKEWQFNAHGKKTKGYPQSREHIRLIENENYKLMTFPMKYSDARKGEDGIGPAKIEGFTPVLSERTLTKIGNAWYAADNSDASSLAEELSPRNPDWSEDEIILALDAYISAKPKDLQKTSREVSALSGLLRKRFQQMGVTGRDTLRNIAGVYMKLQNIKAHDPEYLARGKRGLSAGNQREQRVWEHFAARPAELHACAEQLRLFIRANIQVGDIADDDGMESEGRLLMRVHKTYERSRANRKKKLLHFQKLNNGRVFCECCAFDFERAYGERGRGFIECHHALPVSRLVPNQRLSLSDLRLLCANCHRMIHVSHPWLGVEELAAALETRKS